jgi:hypothetical protein
MKNPIAAMVIAVITIAIIVLASTITAHLSCDD